MVADSDDDVLPEGWAAVVVSRVGSVRLGRQRSPDKHTGQFSTKYIRAANITSVGIELADVLEMDFTPAERELFSLRTGDIVLTEASGSAAHVGRAALWQGELPVCCYQNTVIRFRSHAVTSAFALLVFRHHALAGVFARAARGVGIQHLGASRFAALPFPLPPFPEQVRICAEVERRLSDLRESEQLLRVTLAHIQEQTLEILAAAVAGELVVQEAGAGVAAREGRLTQEVQSLQTTRARSMSRPQRSLFDIDSKAPETIDDPGHPLPRGWMWTRVGAAGDVTLGRQRAPQHHQGHHMRPYLRVANVLEDRIDISDILSMNFTPEEYETYQLKNGDILLNEGQSPELVGRSAIYRDQVPGACFQKTLLRFRPRPDVESEYAQLVFRHYLHTGEFRKVARWSTNIAHLTLERFVVMRFPLPPLAEQPRIVAEARARLDASASQHAAVRDSLAHLRDMEREILAAAVAGKLVPQDETEESAKILLDRLGEPPRPDVALINQQDRSTSGEDIMPTEGRPMTRRTDQINPLDQVLRDTGRPLALPELFSLAGYDRDSSEHVELFYLAVRAGVDRGLIREMGDTPENAVMEIATDAP
jgi:Type I restriction modification DNA specificity domain